MEVIDIDRIEKYFKFENFVPEFWGESNIYHSLLILLDILVSDNPLIDEVTVLVRDLLVQFAKVAW